MGCGEGQIPCEWDVCDPACCPAWDEATDEERDRAKRLAVFLLWSASGRQFGRCPQIIRPCRKSCVSTQVRGSWSGNRWMPILDGGRWYNLDCLCGNTHRCSCTEVCEIELPGWLPEPVRVEIDGRDIPLIEFRVDNGRRLVWEGGDCFPLCQDLSKRLGEPGTWAVEFKSGLPVPAGGDTAASDLACELLKACNPAHSEGCKLPDNVRSVTRQGVTIDFDTTVAASGKFNVPSVDLWVQAANPTGLLRPVEVYSPDVPHPVVTTWGR